MEGTIHLFAPAKVNLVLRVLDRRPDGYHHLWSFMQTVGLEDEVRLRLRPDSHELRVSCDDATLPIDGRNLVVRAVALVRKAACLHDQSPGIEIHLVKRIPVSAGLGGGSSDAAATILGLNRLLRLGWSASDMARVGQALGSDIPFFFFAPSAVVQGRGEEVTPVTLTGKRWVVLVHPGFPIETRWAYERLSEARTSVPTLSDAHDRLVRQAALSWEDVIPLMENDFEPWLTPAHPVLREIKEELLAQGAEAALLSGSGATVFGIFRDQSSAMRAQASAGRIPGRRAYAVRSEARPAASQSGPPQPLSVG